MADSPGAGILGANIVIIALTTRSTTAVIAALLALAVGDADFKIDGSGIDYIGWSSHVQVGNALSIQFITDLAMWTCST